VRAGSSRAASKRKKHDSDFVRDLPDMSDDDFDATDRGDAHDAHDADYEAPASPTGNAAAEWRMFQEAPKAHAGALRGRARPRKSALAASGNEGSQEEMRARAASAAIARCVSPCRGETSLSAARPRRC